MNQSATIDAVAKPPRRRKLLFRVLWSLFALVIGVCLFWTFSYYTALWERDTLIAELRAKGEPVWWEEVAEKALSELTEGTGAKYYLEAINAIAGETNPKAPRVPSKQLLDELEKDKFTPRVHPLVEKELKLAGPALALIEKAVELPPGLVIRNLRTPDPFDIITSNVSDVRCFSRILHWESFDALARGEEKRAYHAVWLSVAASNQVSVDPCAMALFARFNVLKESFNQLMMCLAYSRVPEVEFAAIDRLLAQFEDGLNVKAAMQAQRAMLLTTFENTKHFQFIRSIEWQRSPTRDELSFAFYRKWMDLLSTPLGRPTLVNSQVEYMKAYNRFASMIDDPKAASLEIDVDELERNCSLKRTVGNAEWLDLRLFRAMHRRCRTIHRQIVFARLALRLRMHFDRHGRLPKNLDDLCDATMPKIRLEWFGDQPIVYKPSAKGFSLEAPESIVSPEERSRVHMTPINTEYVFEVEFKTINSTKDGKK
jgi:hypothetical protein